MGTLVSHSAFQKAAEKRDAKNAAASLKNSFNDLDESLLGHYSKLNLKQIISGCLANMPAAIAVHKQRTNSKNVAVSRIFPVDFGVSFESGVWDQMVDMYAEIVKANDLKRYESLDRRGNFEMAMVSDLQAYSDLYSDLREKFPDMDHVLDVVHGTTTGRVSPVIYSKLKDGVAGDVRASFEAYVYNKPVVPT